MCGETLPVMFGNREKCRRGARACLLLFRRKNGLIRITQVGVNAGRRLSAQRRVGRSAVGEP
jgi:hypothetical protein